MSENSVELRNEIQGSFDRMRTLRDEIRVRMHLASMDAKDQWQKIEPELLVVEQVASDFSETTRVAVSTAVSRLTNLRSSLI